MADLIVDNNLFLDTQLSNDKLIWKLMCQPWAITDSRVQEGAEFDVEIIRGIVPETEVKLGISHNYDSNIPIDFSSLKDTVQGVEDWGTMISSGLDSVRKILNGGSSDGLKGKGTNGADMFSKITGNQLVLGSDYVQMFRGTEANYQIPPISTVVYHGQYQQDVLTLLEEIINRLMGQFGMLSEGDTITEQTDGGYLAGWQTPPLGYQPTFSNIGNWDEKIDGTFNLIYAGYEYRYLLIRSFNVTLSTYGIIEGSPTSATTNNMVPLYMKIDMEFAPASYITRSVVKKFLKSKK